MCQTIGKIGDEKYCKLLNDGLGNNNKPETLSYFAVEYIDDKFNRDYSDVTSHNNQERNEKLSKVKKEEEIVWEIIYQSKSNKLIQFALNSRMVCKVFGYVAAHKRKNICDSQGWNVLHYGAYLNNSDLIQIGQNYMNTILTDFENKQKKQHQKFKTIAGLFREWYLSSDIFGNLPIHLACQYGNLTSLKQLSSAVRIRNYPQLKKDMELQIHKINDDGWNCLGLALRYDQFKCVRWLIHYYNNCTDVNWINQRFNGWTILTLIVKS